MAIRDWSFLVSARQMKIHNWSFLVLGCLGLLLQGFGSVLTAEARTDEEHIQLPGFGSVLIAVARTDEEHILGICLLAVSMLALAIGGSFLAVGKGRSCWFGLLGLISPLGLLFLCVLQDRSADHRATQLRP